jgi:hypothetical protein
VASRLSCHSKIPSYEYIRAEGGRESGPHGKSIEEGGRVCRDQVGRRPGSREQARAGRGKSYRLERPYSKVDFLIFECKYFN